MQIKYKLHFKTITDSSSIYKKFGPEKSGLSYHISLNREFSMFYKLEFIFNGLSSM